MLLLATLLHTDTLNEKAGAMTVHSSYLSHYSKLRGGRRRRAAHWKWEGTIGLGDGGQGEGAVLSVGCRFGVGVGGDNEQLLVALCFFMLCVVQAKLRHASRFIHSLRVSPFVAFFDPSSLGSTTMLRSSFATSVFLK